MFKPSRLLFLSLLLMPNALRAAELSFIPLPDLPGEVGRTSAHALSFNGEVAVGESFGFPFRWTKDSGMVALGELPGNSNDVSADGTVVVGSRALMAFRWEQDFGFTSLGEGFGPTTYASNVSADGRFSAGPSDGRAVRWTADGHPEDLGVPTTLPVILSSDGSIAAGTRTDGRFSMPSVGPLLRVLFP
ncbi:MAG: hypothetical protein WD894_18415 [Pirellulales bacterium]